MLSVLALGVWADDTYTPLQWIDYTGEDVDRLANYYDTGYKPVAATRVEFKCLGYGGYTNRWRAIFSGRTSADNGFSIYRNNAADSQFGYFVGGYRNDNVGTFEDNTDYRIIADLESMEVNGISVQTTDRTESNYMGQTDNNITLFSGTNDWPFYGRIYYFNIYEGNTLEHAFVPVLKNGTTPCFHCTVCNDYKEPVGSGFGYSQLTYTPVEYIEYPSVGAETPVSRTFDTGYIPNESTKVVTKFMANANGNWSAIFSGRNYDSGSGISLYKNGNNNTKLGYFVGSYKQDNHADFSINTVYVAECTLGNLKLNGTDYTTDNPSWVATTRSITLFSNPEKDQIFRGRIYYFDIYESDALKHHFIPVKASDNSVGFYDTVDKKYITTRTTTDSQYFTASSSWNGTDDAILPSIKFGSSYSAYTWTKASEDDYGNGEASNSHFNTIVGTPDVDSNGKEWYEVDYQMPTSSSIDWQFGNSVLPNNWATGNKYGDVYVRRNFIIASGTSLPATIYMPVPHDDAPCEYYINGTLIWSRTGTEPSVNGWYEDEVVRLTDTQKALIKTDGTVNVFAFHVHQNWGGRYADGGLYGNAETDGTPSKVFVSNDTRKRLENAVNEAEAEGLSANEHVIRAKTSLNWLQDASYNLEKIRYVIRQHNALKHDYSTLASSEPSDGLEVYIYNVGAGMFLAGGNDWGTHMSLRGQMSHWPMKLHANSSKSGRYTIQSNLPNGVRGTDDGMGHNGYVDCPDWNTTGANWGWDIEAIGDGSYRIINCGDNGNTTDRYLGMTEDYRFQVDDDKTGADNVYNHWKFFTKDQLDALLTTATPSNPADASYYIHQATFQQYDFEGDSKDAADANFSQSKWSATLGGIYNWKGNDVNGDYAYEYYNDPESTTSSEVKLSQTVTDLPAGLYRVTCNGLYRDGGHSAALAAGSCVSKAYLYAGTTSNKVLLPTVFDGKNKGAGYGNLDGGVDCIIPNGPGDAVRFFQNNQYLVSIDVEVGDDGECEIGMIRPAESANSGEWMCVDNFQMYYLGSAITLSEDEEVNPNINTSTYKVTLGRTMQNDRWNTFCVPFAMTGGQITEQFGSGTQVKELSGAVQNGENYTMTFTDADAIEAGKPYMVKPANNVSSFVLTDANGIAVNTTGTTSVTEDGVTFTGTYTNGNAPLGSFIISNNVFYNVDGDVTLKAFRGYITVADGNGVKALNFTFDDDATGIDEELRIKNGESSIYNLAGQRLGKMQKGINIVNGKKILK